MFRGLISKIYQRLTWDPLGWPGKAGSRGVLGHRKPALVCPSQKWASGNNIVISDAFPTTSDLAPRLCDKLSSALQIRSILMDMAASSTWRP